MNSCEKVSVSLFVIKKTKRQNENMFLIYEKEIRVYKKGIRDE